jgi:dehydrogenase/reductase SDR family protein 12
VDLRALLDDGLEISVVGSFTRIGPAVRRRLFGWSAPPAGAMAGRTVLVTGPTSGLGRAATDALAALGARVILVGRSAERIGRLRDELVHVHGEDRFPIVVADMGSLASVRAAVARILETESRLDVLVDNAGAIYPERIEGPDGIEATLAVLAVGPFALVAGLLPLLRRTPGARVIAVTSGGMYTQRLDLDDLQSRAGEYTGALAYARSKRAQTALVREWSRRFAGSRQSASGVPASRVPASGVPGPGVPPSGVSFAVMHPGWADTPGLAETLPGFHRLMRPLLRTAAEGADTIVWLATHADPASTSGRLYLDRRPRPFDRVPSTRLTAADRRRLWDEIVALSGEPDPSPAK